MNLTLAWLWKEWRAQRALLVAWVVLTLASTALVTALLPAHYWKQEDAGSQVLSWFLAVSVLGVVGFAAPQLVRAEFGPKDDQFVRRLPGALKPAFGGKLLFLVLATLLLPLLGLLVGEWFVTAIGRDWNGLFDVRHYDQEVFARWPQAAVFAVGALLLGPWVWAIGTWLPGGRMAVGGAGLLLLVLGFGVAGALRACPGLEHTIPWLPWLLAVWPTGVVLVAVSWLRGRRGGGAARSARFGVAALGLVLLPPGSALGAAAWRYHHPDPAALQHLMPMGTTPDGRWLLAHGAGHPEWVGPPFRIDLATGQAEQLGTLHDYWSPAGSPFSRWFAVQQWWCGEDSLLDLQTGTVQRSADARLRDAVAAAARAGAPFRTPAGRPAWMLDGRLQLEREDGTLEQVDLPRQLSVARPAGHGVWVPGHWFDLGRLRELGHIQKDVLMAVLLREQWFVYTRGVGRASGRWYRQEFDDGTRTEIEALRGACWLGMLDDDRLLFDLGSAGFHALRLVALGRDGSQVEVAHDLDAELDLVHAFTENVRDSSGRLWIWFARDARRGGPCRLFLRVDPTTMRAERMPVDFEVVVRVLDDTVIGLEGDRIIRAMLPSGARTVVYPPAAR